MNLIEPRFLRLGRHHSQILWWMRHLLRKEENITYS